ncbi:hypothetical protein FQN51_003332 [Onygenales sp. PD_10]|nr:hypothetical protein FQN51_003332 [Onygenales sp. PD_10]
MALLPPSLLAGAPTPRKLKPRYSARSFCLILLAVSVLAAASILLDTSSGQSELLGTSQLRKRHDFGLQGLVSRGEDSDECRLVHKAKDQCAFVRTHCADHEIGLFSYLQLYYCKLPNAKPVAFAIIALWLAVLFNTIGIAASDFLCVNLSTIASILGMSESLTGVTFLAFGNGSPDVFSTFAAMSSDSGSLAVGELLGAAGFITAVVAGSMALVRPFRVARRSFVRDVVFFICAASFSLVFLADGKLHAWECATMVVYYAFYVVVVVTWHWYLGKQRRKRERDMAARAHFHIPENQELEIDEEEDDDDPIAGQTQPLIRGPSTEDFDALERGDVPAWKVEDVDEDADTRDLAQLQGNMRLSRPAQGQRRPTITPIRPSLVGALEFRSVLSSLQKSRSIQSGPIHLRRYSDEPGFPEPQTDTQSDRLNPRHDPISTRARAVSANEPGRWRAEDGPLPPSIDLLQSTPPETQREVPGVQPSSQFVRSAGLTASPSSSGFPSRSQSPTGAERSRSPSLLAPPETEFHSPNYSPDATILEREPSRVSPRSQVRDGSQSISRPTSGAFSPTTPFPQYSDITSIRSQSPGLLPRAASLSAESTYTHDAFADSPIEHKPISWWPYNILPSPQAIAAALFPTLYGWGRKSGWERFLGIVAAPCVLLLTITLPVVEPKEPEPETPPEPELNGFAPQQNGPGDPHTETLFSNPSHAIPDVRRISVLPEADELAEANVIDSRASLLTIDTRRRQDSELPVPPTLIQAEEDMLPVPKEWNRWLLAIQLFTAPFFITLTGWVNLDSNLSPRNLLLPSVVSLLLSGTLVTILILSTKTSNNTQIPPRSRPFIAFLGFAVAIAWISTLASEVVNLLKTIGVVLSISDSLLGLTIFAVGNSLGDLVADITIARLGYPVMALSACFGGPMLNILLGVGVGGLYMTLHPGKSSSSSIAGQVVSASGTYRIEVSRTLLISGATLLFTLISLLIVVPMNGWRMDRKIGWGLIALWTVTTVVNVVMEVVS